MSSKKLASSEQLSQQYATKCSHCENLLEPLNIGAGTVVKIDGCDSIIEVENSKTLERPSRLRKQKKVGPDKELEWDLVYGRFYCSISNFQSEYNFISMSKGFVSNFLFK